MRVLLLAALASLGAARNDEGTSFCPDSYRDLEWPNARPGIVCRCVPAQDSSRSFEDCTVNENSNDCEGAFGGVQGENCAWSVYDWSGDNLSNEPATNTDDGTDIVEEDGTVEDCNGQTFSAEDCRYRNKSDCIAYLGDGICDFGQRFTRAGVRTGPNFACARFGFDRGDCDCPDTMTCDGYCLDDRACAKEAYGFERCSDWIRDPTCDYGQRTSDFGVSINFDCDLPASILAGVPGLNFEAQGYRAHDNGMCSEWDWDVRYDRQTLLDNFTAECPEPNITNVPTILPTDAPTAMPTDAPSLDQEAICLEQWNSCYCPSKFAQGRGEECCNAVAGVHEGFPDYPDCVVEDNSIDCSEYSSSDACLQAGFDHCMYNRRLPRGERCYPRMEDGCVAEHRNEDGSWDSRGCKRDTDNSCAWIRGAGYPVEDTDEDGEADTGLGVCMRLDHECNKYSQKDCIKKAIKKGDLCEWSDSDARCEERVFENPQDVCYLHKKKGGCRGFTETHGCRYGKKGGKDKPRGGIFDQNKCFHWSDLCGEEGQQDCAALCDMNAPNCEAIEYQRADSASRSNFRSCERSGTDRRTCMRFADDHNCYWWDGDGSMRHDGSDGEGCYEATLG